MLVVEFFLASDDHTQNSTECLLTPSYFRCLLTNQTELLKSLCKEWSPYLENDDMQNEDGMMLIIR